MPRRLLTVILHGAGPYYLDPLLASGRLPVLARLRAEGCAFPLRSPLPVAAGAWVTMFTGESIGRHGIIDYIGVDASRYHINTGEIASAHTYAERTSFAALSRHGRSIACIALPMTWPAFPLNGIMVAGFPLPDEMHPPTWPPELAASLPPFAPHPLTTLRYRDRANVARWIAFHIDRVTQYAVDCWQSGRFDTVFCCLAAPDIAHHFFWEWDEARTREAIDPVYERVDRALGQLLAGAGPDDIVIVHSDHGGGPAPRRVFGINRWLIEQGWLVPGSMAVGPVVRWTNHAVQWAKRQRLNQWLAPAIKGRLRGRVSDVTHNAAFMDWGRSAAYGMNFFYPLAGVEVNQLGRQPSGIVSAGPRTEALLREITARLQALVDPADGTPVCRGVWRKEELFDGPFLDRFPDLVVELHPDFDVRTQLTGGVLEPNTLQWEYPYLGYHARDGIFVARGPGIPAGETGPVMHMTDVAPTILGAVGVPPLSTMEGRSRLP